MSTSKKNQQASTDNKGKLYFLMGTVITICVLALIAWNNGLFQGDKNPTVATIGEESITLTDAQYYYNEMSNQTYSMAQLYTQMGMEPEYDVSKPATEQFYNEEDNYTYADYFRDGALEQLQFIAILTKQAELADYTLSDEGIASVDAQMQQIDEQLLQYSVTYGGSESYYFSAIYGDTMTKSHLRELIADAVLASEYATIKTASFNIEAEEMETYYTDNAAKLDSYTYRYFFLPITPETDVDENGEALPATEDQIATAKQAVLDSANKAKNLIARGNSFNQVAMDFVGEENNAPFEDENYNFVSNILGSEISASYVSWLYDDTRSAGDVTVFENGDSGVYVIKFLNRERLEESYETLTLNSVLVLADREGDTLPTEDALSTAKEKAQELSQNWTDALIANTNDAFLSELTDYQSELLTDVTRSSYSPDFTTWAFEPRQELPSETYVDQEIENGNVVGYRVMQIAEFGDVQWKYSATNALQMDAYADWYDDMKAESYIEKTDSLALIGSSN